MTTLPAVGVLDWVIIRREEKSWKFFKNRSYTLSNILSKNIINKVKKIFYIFQENFKKVQGCHVADTYGWDK